MSPAAACRLLPWLCLGVGDDTNNPDGFSTKNDEIRIRNVLRRIVRVLLQNDAGCHPSDYFRRRNRGVGVGHSVGLGTGENVGQKVKRDPAASTF